MLYAICVDEMASCLSGLMDPEEETITMGGLEFSYWKRRNYNRCGFCEWSPLTFRLLKRGMVKSLESIDMEQQLRYELANIRRAFSSEDGQEARAAFVEKRKPVFKGK